LHVRNDSEFLRANRLPKGAWRDVWGQIWQVRSMRQRTDVLQLQPVPGLLVPDVHLLGRQGVHLVMRMRGERSSNTDYLAIMVTMTTTNLIIMTTVTLAIMTTAIMVTMTIVDCITLAIMVTLMKNTSSKSCIKDNFAEIQLWQPNVQECIIYHREYILHVL